MIQLNNNSRIYVIVIYLFKKYICLECFDVMAYITVNFQTR